MLQDKIGLIGLTPKSSLLVLVATNLKTILYNFFNSISKNTILVLKYDAIKYGEESLNELFQFHLFTLIDQSRSIS
jgi:hypothetical protein